VECSVKKSQQELKRKKKLLFARLCIALVNISSLTDKAAMIKLKEKYESFNYKTKDADYIEHGKSIFDLIKAR